MTNLILFFLLSGGISVSGIEIQGLRWSSPDFVIFRTGLSGKKEISPLSVRNAIKSLMESEYFDSVEVFGIYNPDSSLKLLIKLHENPRLKELVIKGNKKIGSDELRDSLDLPRGTPLSDYALFRAKSKIKELYRRKGYLKVSVEDHLSEPDENGEATLTLEVHENGKFFIKKIVVEGNRAVSTKKIKSIMKNKERSFLRSGKFDPDQWEEDLDRIVRYYADHGHPEARIDSSGVEYRDDGVYLYVKVYEGSRYVFGKVSFDGNTVYSTDFLSDRIILVEEKPGLWEAITLIYKGENWDPKAYSQSKLEEALGMIQALYGDSGYIYAHAVPFEKIRNDSIVDVEFRIFEGSRVKVRLIDIVGNTKTRESVIRRELDIFPGEYFSTGKLVKSQRDLMYLNYFGNVGVNFRQTEDTSFVDLVFHVEEKSTGQIGAGVSYSQAEGFFGNLNFNQPNLFGRGQSMSILVDFGKKVRNFRFSFTEPWLLGKPQSLGFDVHNLGHYYPEYKEIERGGSVFYSKRLWNDYWHLSLGYTLEKVELKDVSKELESHLSYWGEGPQLTSRANFSLAFDSRDRLFNPIRGTRVSYSVEKAGGVLGGEVHYFRQLLEAGTFRPLGGEKVILHGRTRLGHLESLSASIDVPLYKRFLLGGTDYYGVRGYDDRSIGIYRNGTLIGGRIFNTVTLELRYRPAEGFYVVGFFDAGLTADRFSEFKLSRYKRGAGVGFNIEIPMVGVLGIYESYGFDKLGNKWMTQFQIGTSF